MPSPGRGTTARVNPQRAPLPGGGAQIACAPSSPGRRPGLALPGAIAVALFAHGWLLGLWAGSVPERKALSAADQARRAMVPTFEVRQVALKPLAEPSPGRSGTGPVASTAEAQRAPAAPAPPTPAPRASLLASAPPSPVPTAAGRDARARADFTPSPAAAAPASAGKDESLASAAPPSPPAPPTYRTAPPPSLVLHYDVRRGEASGAARITWLVENDGRYALDMEGAGPAGAGAALTPHWTSRGTLDADGVAPDRFAVSRRGRERHAANFRRDAGIVSFAGPSRTWPLAAGAQDRLSWMVQLAAVLRANPALAAEGAQISMMVVGAHGDAGLWTFTVQPPEPVQGPDGEVLPTWPLVRVSGHAHDPQVQVWLAPALHHLPVRVRLMLPRSGESTEMHLRALQAP